MNGLGETLVGAYPGRALSFICKKSDLDSPKVLGYPSKPIGLFIKRSIIFRSDSNGEDLEGYAGAGLYDRYAGNGLQYFCSLFAALMCWANRLLKGSGVLALVEIKTTEDCVYRALNLIPYQTK